jgi:hypothetical protein
MKPYHTATATGPDGSADYSKWEFLLSAKIACSIIRTTAAWHRVPYSILH